MHCRGTADRRQGGRTMSENTKIEALPELEKEK